MTHEDYMAIAAAIRSTRVHNYRSNLGRYAHNTALDCVARNLADRFKTQDPDFDRAAFLNTAIRRP